MLVAVVLSCLGSATRSVAVVLSCLGSTTRSWSVLVLDSTGGFPWT